MTTNLEARLGYAADDLLGEGPFWDLSSQRLLRVDIIRGLVHSWSPETGDVETVEAGGPVSLAVPTAGGGLVLAVEDRILLIERGQTSVLCRIESDLPNTRLNDGACDRRGRLWVGTYSLRGEPEAGLYCVEPTGEVHQALGGLVASNGLAWTPDESQMYVTDTGKGRISRFAFDAARPMLTDERVFCEIAADEGLPDGIATDVDGGVWVALHRRGLVCRYTADGRLDVQSQLPVRFVTSVAFGGPHLDRLYVTTARHRLSEEEYAGEPLAGGVFVIAAGRHGTPTHRFGAA
ncbi:MAG: SMP-30/gluconolactonase/LRE family protein [Candidatus Nanopelagicales bacterium]